MDNIFNRSPHYAPISETEYQLYFFYWHFWRSSNAELCKATMLEF